MNLLCAAVLGEAVGGVAGLRRGRLRAQRHGVASGTPAGRAARRRRDPPAVRGHRPPRVHATSDGADGRQIRLGPKSGRFPKPGPTSGAGA